MPEKWTRLTSPYDTVAQSQQGDEQAFRDQFYTRIGRPSRYTMVEGVKKPVVIQPNGQEFVDWGPGQGAYTRKLAPINNPLATQDVDYPFRQELIGSEAAILKKNPWSNDPAQQPSLTELQKPAQRFAYSRLIDAWDNRTHEPSEASKEVLRDRSNALSLIDDLSRNVGAVQDGEINSAATLGVNIKNMTGEDMRKAGIGPQFSQHYTAIVNDLEALKNLGVKVPGTGRGGEALPSQPFSSFIANSFLPAAGIAAATNVYDFLKNQENLTRLRDVLPQEANQGRKDYIQTLADDPSARWSKDEARQGNTYMDQNEANGFYRDGNPRTDYKRIEEPGYDPDAAAQYIKDHPGTTLPDAERYFRENPGASTTIKPDVIAKYVQDNPPEGWLARTGEWLGQEVTKPLSGGPSAMPDIYPPGGVGQFIRNIEYPENLTVAGRKLGDIRTDVENAVKATGGALRANPIDLPAAIQATGQALRANPIKLPAMPPAAPVQSQPLPADWGRQGDWGTPLNPQIMPAPVPMRRSPTEDVSSPSTTSARPTIGTDEEYAQLNPGDQFVWHHDGNTYLKT